MEGSHGGLEGNLRGLQWELLAGRGASEPRPSEGQAGKAGAMVLLWS